MALKIWELGDTQKMVYNDDFFPQRAFLYDRGCICLRVNV